LIGGRTADRAHHLRRFLAKPAAVWVGKRSYSLYLWHWPVYVLLRSTMGLDTLATALAGVGGTLLLASASYRLIEVPARHNSTLQRFSPVLRIAAFLLIVVCARRVAEGVLRRNETIGLSTVSRNSVIGIRGTECPIRSISSGHVR
jgi:peptidoglycan/LPS O-acetylase OafA/YrhL